MSRVCCDRTRGNGFRLKECRFRLHIREKCFTVGVFRHWFARDVVVAPSLEAFRMRLNQALGNLIEQRMPLFIAGVLNKMTFKSLFQP